MCLQVNGGSTVVCTLSVPCPDHKSYPSDTPEGRSAVPFPLCLGLAVPEECLGRSSSIREAHVFQHVKRIIV